MNVIRVLLGAAGVASLAYLAYRQKLQPVVRRPVSLASLDRDVANWLPKLPYLPFVRIEVVPGGDCIELTEDDGHVQVGMPLAGPLAAARAARFRQTCEALGWVAGETAPAMGARRMICNVPAMPDVAAHLIDRLLRDVYGLQEQAMLSAAVPNAYHVER